MKLSDMGFTKEREDEIRHCCIVWNAQKLEVINGTWESRKYEQQKKKRRQKYEENCYDD